MSCHGNSGQKKDIHKSEKHSNNSHSDHSDKGHGFSSHTLHLIMMLILVGILIYYAFVK